MKRMEAPDLSGNSYSPASVITAPVVDSTVSVRKSEREFLGLPKVLLTVLVAEPAAKHYCLWATCVEIPGNDFVSGVTTLILT